MTFFNFVRGYSTKVRTYKNAIWHSDTSSAYKSDVNVIVCGWAASKQPHVEKYSSLFSKDFGLQTHGNILPMEILFDYNQGAQRRFAIEVLDAIAEKVDGGQKTKLVVLNLSNNGAAVYQHLAHLCKNEDAFQKKFEIAGAIFDSGPGPLSWPAYMVCGLNLGSNKTLHKLITPSVPNEKRKIRPISTSLLYYYIDRMEKGRTISQSISDARRVNESFKECWRKYAKDWPWPGEYLLAEKESWPFLFLYSDNDRMMPSAFIERVISAQKSSGRCVTSHNFLTSPHVAHLRHHEKTYKEKVREFLQKIDPNI